MRLYSLILSAIVYVLARAGNVTCGDNYAPTASFSSAGEFDIGAYRKDVRMLLRSIIYSLVH